LVHVYTKLQNNNITMATATIKGLGNGNHCTYHYRDSSSSYRNTYGLWNDYLFWDTLFLVCACCR
jgi:hypothetical protein